MNSLPPRIRKVWKFFSSPSRIQREIMRESWPFLVFLTLVLVGMSAVLLVQSSQFRDPLRLAVFVIMMTAHIAAHWLSGWSSLDRRWSIVYLFGQGFLAAGIVLFTGLPQIGPGPC